MMMIIMIIITTMIKPINTITNAIGKRVNHTEGLCHSIPEHLSNSECNAYSFKSLKKGIDIGQALDTELSTQTVVSPVLADDVLILPYNDNDDDNDNDNDSDNDNDNDDNLIKENATLTCTPIIFNSRCSM